LPHERIRVGNDAPVNDNCTARDRRFWITDRWVRSDELVAELAQAHTALTAHCSRLLSSLGLLVKRRPEAHERGH
jgi:hypothetical protein